MKTFKELNEARVRMTSEERAELKKLRAAGFKSGDAIFEQIEDDAMGQMEMSDDDKWNTMRLDQYIGGAIQKITNLNK